MNTTTTTTSLPTPSVHCGGFLHAREAIGLLNGTPLPQERVWSKFDRADEARRIEAREAALAALDDAPEGAVYEFTQTSPGEGWVEKRTFKKNAGEWVLTRSYSYP
ncbi:MAG: hypothetical protein ACR2HF_13900 [Methylococcaceae bacterium]